MPGLALLNCLTSAVLSPDVSLPRQNVTLPFAPFMDAGSMTFAPSILGASLLPLLLVPPPPPPPPPLLLLLSLPQAATTPPPSRAATKNAVRRLDTSSPSSVLRRRHPGPRTPPASCRRFLYACAGTPTPGRGG